MVLFGFAIRYPPPHNHSEKYQKYFSVFAKNTHPPLWYFLGYVPVRKVPTPHESGPTFLLGFETLWRHTGGHAHFQAKIPKWQKSIIDMIYGAHLIALIILSSGIFWNTILVKKWLSYRQKSMPIYGRTVQFCS